MKWFTSIILCIASLFLSIFDLPTYPHGKSVDMSKFELVFSDEFDGNELDTAVWSSGYGIGNTSVRKGGYWNTDMATVEDGNLHIATKYFPDGYKGNGKPGWYTTEITTQNSFTQCRGYFETRCILPKGFGMWSAFWLFGHGVGKIGNEGIDGTEIDIFESPYYSKDNIFHNAVTSNLHYDGYGEEHRQKNICRSLIYTNNPYEEYNTYAIEWSEKEYTVYINGIKAGSSKFGGVSQDKQWLILSVEVGGSDGVPAESWAGPSIETNPDIITDFIVDYVRVYQYK